MADDLVEKARKAYDSAREWEDECWREPGLEDLKFARMPEDNQWPASAKEMRGEDRPMLTLSKMGNFIRQVVNDARQNKPAILVRPAGGDADKDTADILSGLVRNIEYTSDADVAYDTACENAVTCGVGYFRIDMRHTSEDTFDQDIAIDRIGNSFSVYGDPNSERADSSDWEQCFVTSWITKRQFEREYKDAEKVDWDTDYGELSEQWISDNKVMVAEWWTREKYYKTVVLLDSGQTVTQEEYEDQPELFGEIVEERDIECWKVMQRIVTGKEVLEEIEWPGKYIPIVPVYGDEINIEGKRYFRSLIHDAKDAQRMYNYWRSTATEMVALAPRAPWVGEEGTFDVDDWDGANNPGVSYLEYASGKPPPTRQFFEGSPIAMINEALAASDDIKNIIGMQDASLGIKSNETSGVAIRARQMEGDVATFHFLDNLTRAIRHGGRILLDLIPKVYNADRIIRILGPDMEPQMARISPDPEGMTRQMQMEAAERAADEEQLAELMEQIPRIYDLTSGKYDLTVKAGPSYTTLREETRTELVELFRVADGEDERKAIAKLYLKNSDWPGAEEILEDMEGSGLPPEVEQQMQEGMQLIQQLQQENAQLKADQRIKMGELQLKAEQQKLDARKIEVDGIKAQADLIRAQAGASNPYMQ